MSSDQSPGNGLTTGGMSAARLAQLCGRLRGGRSPAYRQLTDALQVLIGDGRLPSSSRLPAERAMAEALGTSRITVTRAYRELRTAGWADARQGAGTWVRLPQQSVGVDGVWAPGPIGHDVIDLAHAAPAACPLLGELVARAGEALGPHLTGHGYGPEGLPALRERVAARFVDRGLPTDPDQIVVTGGALQAIAISLATLAGPGDRVLIEHPTYPSALDVLADLGAAAVPVATGPDRAPQDALPHAARQTTARAAYLMADFQNPTGRLLDDDARARLIHRLGRHATVAVVDETVVELDLRDDRAPVPAPCAAHARHRDDVVTIGGLSKLAWGGLRIGWIRAGREQAARMRRRLARSQLGLPVFDQLVAVQVLDRLPEVRQERIRAMRARRDRLLAELAARLPHWRCEPPGGGLALWCDLGAPVATRLAAAAPRHGLVLTPGPRFGTGHAFLDRLRLPYTHPEPVLAEAVARLARAVADLDGPRAAAGDAATRAGVVV